MASKKKESRQAAGLYCSVCKFFNYITQYNKNNEITKKQKDNSATFPIKKFCPHCNKRTDHKLSKKLK